MEIVPFVLFSLPVGVWLDRWRKLRVYVIGEFSLALTVASVPLAWWSGWLSIPWLYVAAFVIGSVNTTAGSAAQIVLTQIVPRERLVEAHAKNALANSTAEVAGPAVPEGAAGESLLIWRQDANVCHRVLAESERQVLELVAAGTSFGVVCDTLPSWRPTEEASAQAFGWLWSWATADLLVAPSGDLLLPGAAG